MGFMIAEWRFKRAIYRGKLTAHPEVEHEIREEASQHRAGGRGWYVEGLDGVGDDEILKHLQDVGVTTSKEEFQEMAPDMPGPTEVAMGWLSSVQGSEGYTPVLLELAARALWKRWMTDVPSIEDAGDLMEDLMLKARHSETGPEDALFAMEKFIELSEGDSMVADAISEELPIRIWPWILDQYRAETLGERSIEDWMKAGEEILPLFPSSAILLATMGRMGASCGAEDVARKHLEDSLESGGAHASFVLTEVALGYASLGEDGLAFAMGEKALVCAEDTQDEKDAAATIEQVCERLGCPERAESHIHQAKKNRMEQTMAKRRDRRRKDKKGKGRRR